jgi:hypothetical protein
MTGTPRDRNLEDAQKEIQRRLLRQEKLKRIEDEEMRRLAGTGWQPPIERTIPPQESAHGNASPPTLIVYKPRSAYVLENSHPG